MLDTGDDALLGRLAGVADRVDDVRHEPQVAVAHVVRRVGRRPRGGLRVTVDVVRVALVEVHHHRVLASRIEPLGLDEDSLQLDAVAVRPVDDFGPTPSHPALERAGVGEFATLAETHVGDPHIGELRERGHGEEQPIRLLGPGQTTDGAVDHQQLLRAVDSTDRVRVVAARLRDVVLGRQENRVRQIEFLVGTESVVIALEIES